MARHKLTEEEQMRGITKALANPKTPDAFRPSLEKRLVKLRASSAPTGSNATARGSR